MSAADTEAAASTMDTGDWDFVQDLEELKNAFKSGGVEECRIVLERKRDAWRNVPLNVAVTGNSGVGKSSFINAIRRLDGDDDGAAAVGVKETTLEIRSYEHPDNPMLKFWDLPGVGTDAFPRSTYLADIDVDRYDFFLLMTADRFTENDTLLGNEFHERKKKYFFVRTKIGVDVSNNEKAHPKTHNEDAVVEEIRESTQQHLRKHECEDVHMFLIDNYEPTKYDFEKLEHQLVEDFPKLKKTTLILSLQATSEEMVRLKAEELRSRMWKLAALSAVVAAVPVPGMSALFDLGLVATEAEVYYKQLGLDETSLRRYARLTSSDYDRLQSVVDRRLGCKIIGVEGIKKLLETLSKRAAPLLASTALEEGSRLIPIIGSFIAAPLSFGGTYYVLNLVLKRMESVALEVVKTAASSDNGKQSDLHDDD